MAPVFGLRTLLMLVLPVGLAAGILAAVGKRGTGVFKKQGVAWGLTLLMVFAAIGIGYAKAPIHDPVPEPYLPGAANSFVWDEAKVLSDQTVRTLDSRNDRLWDKYQVTIGVVTCNYGKDDLDQYVLKQAEKMGLGGYDMIVALDIKGDNYWLIQGADLAGDFTDQDCSDYAYDYMETWFAAGDYDFAVEQLTEMLELWYGTYYG